MSAAMPPEYVDAFFSFFVDGTLDESEVLPTVRVRVGPAAAVLRGVGASERRQVRNGGRAAVRAPTLPLRP